jgi:hypothetical protein
VTLRVLPNAEARQLGIEDLHILDAGRHLQCVSEPSMNFGIVPSSPGGTPTERNTCIHLPIRATTDRARCTGKWPMNQWFLQPSAYSCALVLSPVEAVSVSACWHRRRARTRHRLGHRSGPHTSGARRVPLLQGLRQRLKITPRGCQCTARPRTNVVIRPIPPSSPTSSSSCAEADYLHRSLGGDPKIERVSRQRSECAHASQSRPAQANQGLHRLQLVLRARSAAVVVRRWACTVRNSLAPATLFSIAQ